MRSQRAIVAIVAASLPLLLPVGCSTFGTVTAVDSGSPSPPPPSADAGAPPDAPPPDAAPPGRPPDGGPTDDADASPLDATTTLDASLLDATTTLDASLEDATITPTPRKRVFVTLDPIVPLLGAAGFDAYCATEAGSGAWMAWVSEGTMSPAQRFIGGGMVGPWHLATGAAPLVATGANLLTSGVVPTIQTPINASLRGPVLSGPVWTGVDVNGAPASECNGWTVGVSLKGSTGSSSASDVSWMSGGGQLCNALARIYCFEK